MRTRTIKKEIIPYIGQEQSKKKSFRILYARACLRLRGYCSISTMKLRFFGTNSYRLSLT